MEERDTKKLLALLLALALALSLAACGTGDDGPEGTDGAKEPNKTEGAKGSDATGSEQKPQTDPDNPLGISESTLAFIKSINADNAEATGMCGADLTWYYLNNVLVIRGTGEMTDYDGQRPG